jgi:hypothetical protein
MKKYLKRGLVLLLVLVQLFCLCGCDALDEMRENQVSANEDGSITWKGTVYKALPYCEYLWVDTEYEAVYVTEPDVPVLLSPMFADKELYISTQGNFLVDERDDWADWVYYCPEDQYDELCARFDAPFAADKVCYAYDVYDDDYEYRTAYYTLTEQQVATVARVLQEVEPTTMQVQWLPYYEYSMWLMECSEDMLLRRDTMELAVNEGSYCIFVYTDTEVLVYTVPDTLTSDFAQIAATYIDAYEAMWGEDEYSF